MSSKIKLLNNQGDELTLEHSDTLSAQGNSVVNIKDVTKQVDTIADLKLLDGSHKLVYVTGYHTAGDGAFGSHFFEWDATSTEVDNGGTIIKLTGVATGRYKLKYDGSVNVRWFGAVGDGAVDDTVSIQNAIDCGAKKIIVGFGVNGVYKISNAIFFNLSGQTLEFENNSIVLKKFYGSNLPGYGNAIVVNSAYNKFINLGIDGNGEFFGGSGIVFNTSTTYYTYGCSIINPNIKNTRDSCIVFSGPRGAPDIVIDGGSLITYQDPSYNGASSSGFPAIRIVGPIDDNPSPRVFTNITASSTILADLTGMNGCKISNCFTGTFLFNENPDATGGTNPYRTGEIGILNTYIRDGINIKGFEISIDNCLSHGYTPLTWDSYGGTPTTYSSNAWEISNNSEVIKCGPNNVLSHNLKDNSAQGVAWGLLASYYDFPKAYNCIWSTSGGTQPSIGDGTLTSVYASEGLSITVNIELIIGTTTGVGTGDLIFSLPKWTSTTAGYTNGVWSAYLPGIGRKSGVVTIAGTGSRHTVLLLLGDGTPVNNTSVPSIPSGSSFNITYRYIKG